MQGERRAGGFLRDERCPVETACGHEWGCACTVPLFIVLHYVLVARVSVTARLLPLFLGGADRPAPPSLLFNHGKLVP